MTTTSSYSPFWPIQIVVVCLGIWTGYQLWGINSERVASDRSSHQILPQGEAALTAKKKLFALVEDLNHLSAQDPNAAQILSEFKIQMQAAPTNNAGK